MTDYEILGVEPSASQEEIRKAYVFLASRFHPDANPGREEQAAEHFRKVDAAYKRIRDGALDALLGSPRSEAPRPAPAPHAPQPSWQPVPPRPLQPEFNCTMKEFIAKIAEDYEPARGKAVAKSIGMTILKTGLMNALTLPFGRVSFGISRYKPLTKAQYQATLMAALFPAELKKLVSARLLDGLPAIYDKASLDAKVQILTLAVKEPKKYLKWVTENISG